MIEKIVVDFQASTGGLSASTNEARIEIKTLKDELTMFQEGQTKLREELGTSSRSRRRRLPVSGRKCPSGQSSTRSRS